MISLEDHKEIKHLDKQKSCKLSKELKKILWKELMKCVNSFCKIKYKI